MKVLVTGGTGYIGSHTAVLLIEAGYDVVVIDNLVNSKIEVTNHIKEITGKDVVFYKGDVRDKKLLEKIFTEHKIDVVIHFAGLKAVGESVMMPLEYYNNNILSTINLCEVMQKFNCKKIIFSSSATVYGKPEKLPLTEDCRLSVTNPYGATKLYNEGILKDLYISDNEWSVCLLRYFNPVGAHKSGLIGENPNGIPNNLMPYIVRVALKEYDCLNIYGNDYNTKDGTGVRDYIHVIDLAYGHIKAIDKVMKDKGVFIYNLGTGTGYSVLEMVKTFEKVNDVTVKYKFVERRPGDVDACYADSNKALKELNWQANLGIEDMCKDAYNFALKCQK